MPRVLAGPHHGWETVLIVADRETDRAVLASMLRRNGYRVLEARHGGQAVLSCLNADPVHLVLTDLTMPDMSGRELVERLTALRPDIKALYITYGGQEIARPAGPVTPVDSAALRRPFTSDTLAWKVREILDVA